MSNQGSSNGVLILLLGIILGAGGLYYYNTKIAPKPSVASSPTQSSATVRQIGDVYVFINSSPVKKTIELGTYQTDIAQTINAIFDFKNKSVWDKISEIGKTFAFNQKIRENIQKIKQQYPDAEAVVFDERLDRCSVLKYK